MEIRIALTRAGRIVLRPLSAGLRYDLALDNADGTLTRLQCKTGVLHGDVITFRTCISDARRPNGVPYHGQVEAFGVYCQALGKSYLVPIEAVKTGVNARLRLGRTRNGQRKGVREARQFEIGAPLQAAAARDEPPPLDTV